jgi:ATP-dependent 26S proteasome regulatory subunit
MQNHGRLLIATANDREKVPEALIREGRIDKEYLFSNASEAQLKGLFLRTHVWLEEETKDHDLNMLAEEFSLKVASDTYPPAAITSYLKGVAGPKEAISNIADIGVTVS